MITIRKTAQWAALGLGLFLSVPATRTMAQGYNDRRYNSGYNDYNDYSDYDGTYQDFYDALSPYGEWINDAEYGYVWVPDVDQNFRPYYSNGYWAMTNYGNTWVSNYPWGWAAFHYGRWSFDNYYGWVWIPGDEWAPAWVDWRSTSNGYYGWAPMGPGSYNYYSNDYYGNSSWWVFAPQQYLYSPNIYNYVRSPRYNTDYLRRSSIIRDDQRSGRRPNYFSGPRRADVERAIGHPITVMNVTNTRRAGVTRIDNNRVNIFRPRIQASNNSNREVRPAQVQQGQLRLDQRSTRQPRNTNDNGGMIMIPERLRNDRQGGAGQPGRGNDRNNVLREQQQNEELRRNQYQQQQQQRDQQQRDQQQMMQRAQQERAQQQQREQQQMMQQAQQQREQQQREQQQREQQRIREQQMQQQRAQQDQQMRQQREQQEQQRQQQREQQQQQQREQRIQEQPRQQPQQAQPRQTIMERRMNGR